MTKMKRSHSAAFKTKIALEAIRQDKTQSQITNEFGVHATQINTWKKQALESINEGFSCKRKKDKQATEELTSELYKQIGQLKVELDWLKKKFNIDC